MKVKLKMTSEDHVKLVLEGTPEEIEAATSTAMQDSLIAHLEAEIAKEAVPQ